MTMTDAELAEIRARADAVKQMADTAQSVLIEMDKHDRHWHIKANPDPDSNADLVLISLARMSASLATDYIALLDELAAARKENERYREWLERQSRAYYDQFQNSDKADMSYSEGQYQMATRALHRFLALHSATEDADDRTT